MEEMVDPIRKHDLFNEQKPSKETVSQIKEAIEMTFKRVKIDANIASMWKVYLPKVI